MSQQNALWVRGTILGIATLAFALGLAAAWRNADHPLTLPQGLLWPAGAPLAEFSLIDHQGREFPTSRLRGRPHLLFFGYTHCPDVCPGTLAALRELASRLAQNPLAVQPGIVFVTIDPARDTPEVLRDYVGYYSPDFLGLTGSAEALKRLTQALSVIGLAPMQHPPREGYLVDHSASILLLDDDTRLVGRLPAPHTGAGLEIQLRTLIQTLAELH